VWGGGDKNAGLRWLPRWLFMGGGWAWVGEERVAGGGGVGGGKVSSCYVTPFQSFVSRRKKINLVHDDKGGAFSTQGETGRRDCSEERIRKEGNPYMKTSLPRGKEALPSSTKKMGRGWLTKKTL